MIDRGLYLIGVLRLYSRRELLECRIQQGQGLGVGPRKILTIVIDRARDSLKIPARARIELGHVLGQLVLGQDIRRKTIANQRPEGLSDAGSDGIVIELLNLDELASHDAAVAQVGVDIVVADDISEGEDDVIGGEGRSVGPPDSLA